MVELAGDGAAARKALGRDLARFRVAAGLTQHDLAPKIQYARSTVANVEVGRQLAPRVFWQRCDDALRADGELVEAYDRCERQRDGKRRLAAQVGDVVQALDGYADIGVARVASQQIGRAGLVDVALQQADDLAGASDADLVDLLTVLDGKGVGGATMTAAELTGEQLDKGFASSGPEQARQRIGALLRAVTEQLRLPQSLDHQRRLVALAGRLAGLRAWCYFDLDQHAEAERWYSAAVTAAEESESWSLGAWLLGAQSLIPWHRGDHRHAVALIQKGLLFAGNGSDSTTVAWLHALSARGCAGLGDPEGYEKAYQMAEEASDSSNERDRRHGTDFHQGVIDLRYYAGTSRLLLRQPERATAPLNGSLQSLPDSHIKARAVLTLAKADAAAQSGDFDEAVELTRSALMQVATSPYSRYCNKHVECVGKSLNEALV